MGLREIKVSCSGELVAYEVWGGRRGRKLVRER